jgi:hypothetical protein
MRDAGFSEFPLDAGDPRVETMLGAMVNQTPGELLKENQSLKARAAALERLHAYKPLSSHYLLPQ